MKQYIYTAKDKRMRMVIQDDNGYTTSISYPRILMEQKLGRPLEPNEDVHHIDEDKTNNNLDNLEVIRHGIHQSMHSKYFTTIQYCRVCGKPFIFTPRQMSRYMIDIRRGRNRVLTCSKKCSGISSHWAHGSRSVGIPMLNVD